MGSVKISVGGTWKDAKSTTTTTQSCSTCQYNCTNYCAGNGCSAGCDGSSCTGLCRGGCNTYCTTCTGCSTSCRGTCYTKCTGRCEDYSRMTKTTYSPGDSNPGTSNTYNRGYQYGSGTGTQTTTTTQYTGKINVGGVQTDFYHQSKRRWNLEKCEVTPKGGFHLWAA